MNISNAISYRDFERAVAGYRVKLHGDKCHPVELLRIPSLARTYLALVSINDGWPPTQDEFANMMDRVSNVSIDRAGLDARVRRAYMSFVVQHHFALVCKQRFTDVAWDPYLDMACGVDVVVSVKESKFGFGLACGTNRADEFKRAKAHRYKAPGFPVRHIYIREDEHPVGQFWLYNPKRSGELSDFVYNGLYCH